MQRLEIKFQVLNANLGAMGMTRTARGLLCGMRLPRFSYCGGAAVHIR
jgi:hypothetical protein